MNLIRLLQSQGNQSLRRLVVDAFASAFSTTVMLAVVTYTAQTINDSRQEFVDLPVAALFVLGVFVYVFFEGRMVARLAADIEQAIDALRMQLIDRLRHADLWRLEHFGQSRLYESITRNCKTLSSESQYLALALRSLVLIATILLYIATVSLTACLLLTALLALASAVYIRLNKSLERRQNETADQEAKLFECVADLFDGFKEQRLSSVRSRALGAAFGAESAATVAARCTVHLQSWQQFVFGETTFNLMLGLVVFIVPLYVPAVGTDLVKLSAAILFMITPVFSLMQSLAVMRAAESAAGRMLALEGELAPLEEPGSRAPQHAVAADFATIGMQGIVFAFPAPAGEIPFTVGPLDLTIRRGELVFVTGGNGAGKSTFIKMLTGLYQAQQGCLTIGGQPLSAAQRDAYRALIVPVFSDFHLFDRFYGLREIDTIKANEYLDWMEMSSVTEIFADRFARIDLSTGQRKRLALIAALLEAKPILILDEWAADQDAHFRLKFYREILPELKRRGLTIIAVTHDDRYFDVADRRLHLDEGRLVECLAGAGDAK